MHMAVDPSRQHEAPARINDVVGRTKVLTQGSDAAGADADVARNRIAGRNYAAAAYDGIELCHTCGPLLSRKWCSSGDRPGAAHDSALPAVQWQSGLAPGPRLATVEPLADNIGKASTVATPRHLRVLARGGRRNSQKNCTSIMAASTNTAGWLGLTV